MSTTPHPLALELGVKPEALDALGVTRNGSAWLIPERDADGVIIGQAKRYDDGSKGFVAGGNRGLTMPCPFPPYAGSNELEPVYVVEGASDTAAGMSIGLDIVGRPSATGGAKLLRELLAGRHVVVIEERDEAGKLGAEKIAGELYEVCDSVRILRPREPFKDLRAWLAEDTWITREDMHGFVEDLPHYRPPGGPLSLASLIAQNPTLSAPVVDGLLRHGETCNIVAPPKVGKSWLVYSLAMEVAMGGLWLGTFPCTPGRVLLIDNELHPATIANRMPKVCAAMGINPADVGNRIDVLSLRGRGITLDGLATFIGKIERGTYSLIVCDAWYRFIPRGMNENSNADVMSLYNLLDEYAESTGAAIVAVHHSSKGAQGDKAVTDVGAGAGSQSRAADAHVVLRTHEQDGCVVMEAVVRSFAPIEPVALRWEFPRWTRAEDIDPDALKDRKPKHKQKQEAEDAKAIAKMVDALRPGALTPRRLREVTGYSPGRVSRLLDRMVADELVTYEEVRIKGNDTREYSLAP